MCSFKCAAQPRIVKADTNIARGVDSHCGTELVRAGSIIVDRDCADTGFASCALVFPFVSPVAGASEPDIQTVVSVDECGVDHIVPLRVHSETQVGCSAHFRHRCDPLPKPNAGSRYLPRLVELETRTGQ